MRYEKVAKEDLSAAVARQLRSAILTGAHQPGDLLPPERDLATQFGVDRHTLRSALSELEQLGLVQRRQGSGCRVLDFRETGTLDLIKYLVVEPGTEVIDPTMVGSVMEVGRVTLQGLMDLVVEHSDPGDLDIMRRALDALADSVAVGDAPTIVGCERRFLRLVFRGSHSVVAELLANTFDQIFDAAIDPEGRVRRHWGDVIVSSGRLRRVPPCPRRHRASRHRGGATARRADRRLRPRRRCRRPVRPRSTPTPPSRRRLTNDIRTGTMNESIDAGMHPATLWEALADRLGDEPAVIHASTTTTWRELDRHTAGLAVTLQTAGLGPSSKVAAYLFSGPEFLETYFAAFKLRAQPVNVNYRYRDAELAYLLENSDAEALVFHSSLADRVAAIDTSALAVLIVLGSDPCPNR